MIFRKRDLCARLGVSATTLWRWVRAGKFPQPVRLGPNTVGWPEADVQRWLSERIQECRG